MTPLYTNGIQIFIGEIATIEFGYTIKEGDATTPIVKLAMQPGMLQAIATAIQDTIKRHAANQVENKSKLS